MAYVKKEERDLNINKFLTKFEEKGEINLTQSMKEEANQEKDNEDDIKWYKLEFKNKNNLSKNTKFIKSLINIIYI